MLFNDRWGHKKKADGMKIYTFDVHMKKDFKHENGKQKEKKKEECACFYL